ncbi:metallophosphoesterase family protein [Gynuella sunshinyii]|uniref:Putative phosphoesterase n=1 Tax=Gynuella sunshinyii YC6258 TaxID=1445510 RepID=A0A0C5VMR2_9GAMM|nr:metallophosphoesterase family protein [Gynuella sunshinyii]AJQ96017.1 putative phosphoesterase [Gynuella sunshinyii YC6258]
MKVALLSDIHSNVYALQATLNDIQTKGVDITVNLGDILYGPIAPRATYELLMQHSLVTIRGNQDRQIYEATAEDIRHNPTMEFILQDLGDEPLKWMRQLPFDQQLTEEIYLCHGTPTDDLIYLLEDVSNGYPKLRTDGDIIQLLNGNRSEVILCGHTHIPRMVMTTTKQLIVNPGSIGLPAYTDDEPVLHSMQNFAPHASYALIEKISGSWKVEHIKVPYDYQNAARDAEKRQRDDWVHYLTTGTA